MLTTPSYLVPWTTIAYKPISTKFKHGQINGFCPSTSQSASLFILAMVIRSTITLCTTTRTVSSRSSTVFLKLYKALVRPILDFGTCLAGPFYKSDNQLVEGVQRRATKCIDSLRSQPYCRRLHSVNLPTLVFQCRHNNMLLTYRYLQQADQKLFTFSPHQKQTQGLTKKLFKSSINTRVRLDFFSQQVVNDWNQLSQETVSATLPKEFKEAQ